MSKRKRYNNRLRALLSFVDNDIAVLVVLLIVLAGLGVLGVTVSWLVAIIAAVLFVAKVLLLRIVIIPQLLKTDTGREGIIGLQGRVVKPLTPVGVVMVEGERWNTRSANGDIGIDQEVEVKGMAGLMLTVKRFQKE